MYIVNASQAQIEYDLSFSGQYSGTLDPGEATQYPSGFIPSGESGTITVSGYNNVTVTDDETVEYKDNQTVTESTASPTLSNWCEFEWQNGAWEPTGMNQCGTNKVCPTVEEVNASKGPGTDGQQIYEQCE